MQRQRFFQYRFGRNPECHIVLEHEGLSLLGWGSEFRIAVQQVPFEGDQLG